MLLDLSSAFDHDILQFCLKTCLDQRGTDYYSSSTIIRQIGDSLSALAITPLLTYLSIAVFHRDRFLVRCCFPSTCPLAFIIDTLNTECFSTYMLMTPKFTFP